MPSFGRWDHCDWRCDLREMAALCSDVTDSGGPMANTEQGVADEIQGVKWFKGM